VYFIYYILTKHRPLS